MDCFIDADWAGDNLDRKSTTGYVIQLFGNVIQWKSRKLKCVTKASTSAEYAALSEATSELKFVRELVEMFNVNEDNSCAINRLKYVNFTKHIEVHYHQVHESFKENIIDVIKIDSDENVANIFTVIM